MRIPALHDTDRTLDLTLTDAYRRFLCLGSVLSRDALFQILKKEKKGNYVGPVRWRRLLNKDSTVCVCPCLIPDQNTKPVQRSWFRRHPDLPQVRTSEKWIHPIGWNDAVTRTHITMTP